MANKVLYISFKTYDKKLFLVINHQVHKYRIIARLNVISIPDFNTIFIYL